VPIVFVVGCLCHLYLICNNIMSAAILAFSLLFIVLSSYFSLFFVGSGNHRHGIHRSAIRGHHGFCSFIDHLWLNRTSSLDDNRLLPSLAVLASYGVYFSATEKEVIIGSFYERHLCIIVGTCSMCLLYLAL